MNAIRKTRGWADLYFSYMRYARTRGDDRVFQISQSERRDEKIKYPNGGALFSVYKLRLQSRIHVKQVGTLMVTDFFNFSEHLSTDTICWNEIPSQRKNTWTKMGKRNSKLKQDTIDKLLADTYCKYHKLWLIWTYNTISTFIEIQHLCPHFLNFPFVVFSAYKMKQKVSTQDLYIAVESVGIRGLFF